MAVYNDSYDNYDEYKADLAWEYRKGGPNDDSYYGEDYADPEDTGEGMTLAEWLKRGLNET